MEIEFEHELKMALACKLFEMGRLTSGHAAELAGVSRYAFLHEISQYRVNAIDWDDSEISQEIENAHVPVLQQRVDTVLANPSIALSPHDARALLRKQAAIHMRA